MRLSILFIFLSFNSLVAYSQISSLAGTTQVNGEGYRSNIKYYHAGEIGNRYGKHFEVSFILEGNGVITFYNRDNSVSYSGAKPEFLMIDNYVWFNQSYSYIPSPRNWVSTHRYDFGYPSIDDVEGVCSVQTEAYSNKFSLYIYNSSGYNRVRLFLPFKIRE